MSSHPYLAAADAESNREPAREPARDPAREPSLHEALEPSVDHLPKNSSIGRILLEMGKITPEDAERVLITQKKLGMRFGEAAEHLGLITEADIQKVLARQFDYPYLQKKDVALPEELVAAYRPFTPQVETLRAIRSQLMLRWFTKERRALAIVSVDQNDGVSIFTANLAIVFSQLGEHTLLVDANMRLPRQQKLFGLSNNMGFSDVLAGRTDQSEIAKIDSFVDLSVLSAGTLPPNPQELLSRGFAQFTLQQEQKYDVILYDTSAFNTAADALVIASRVGGVLVVVQQEKTRVADVNLLCEQFLRNGVEVVGVVMAKF
ncbi:protein-tyrosine kinase [Oxalobacteraceae bacterium GrIS 2.11]